MMTAKLSLLVAACAALPLATAATAGDDKARGEQELARVLEDRTPGEPVRCLPLSQRRNMQVVDGTALVFRDGATIYVNRPDGARFLDVFDVPVFKLYGSSELCARDHATLHDSSTGMPGPLLVLGEFIPYRRTN